MMLLEYLKTLTPNTKYRVDFEDAVGMLNLESKDAMKESDKALRKWLGQNNAAFIAKPIILAEQIKHGVPRQEWVSRDCIEVELLIPPPRS